MAVRRVLNQFPLNLNIGTDICHVVRIRTILESARANRFIHKILNVEERGHPKIQWMLSRDASAATSRKGRPPGRMQDPQASEREAHGDSSSSSTGLGQRPQELQVAATFLAGRCAVSIQGN